MSADRSDRRWGCCINIRGKPTDKSGSGDFRQVSNILHAVWDICQNYASNPYSEIGMIARFAPEGLYPGTAYTGILFR